MDENDENLSVDDVMSHVHKLVEAAIEGNVGLGPEHDWSSHCADAFGLLAVAYEKMHSDQNRRAPNIELVKRV